MKGSGLLKLLVCHAGTKTYRSSTTSRRSEGIQHIQQHAVYARLWTYFVDFMSSRSSTLVNRRKIK